MAMSSKAPFVLEADAATDHSVTGSASRLETPASISPRRCTMKQGCIQNTAVSSLFFRHGLQQGKKIFIAR